METAAEMIHPSCALPVKRRHRSGGMTHLLTNNGGDYSSKFPSPVAASPKGMHPSLLKSQSFQSRIESSIQNVSFKLRAAPFRMKDKRARIGNDPKKPCQFPHRFLALRVTE
jgi:hypothetical protein